MPINSEKKITSGNKEAYKAHHGLAAAKQRALRSTS